MIIVMFDFIGIIYFELGLIGICCSELGLIGICCFELGLIGICCSELGLIVLMPKYTKFNQAWFNKTDSDGVKLNIWLKEGENKSTFQCDNRFNELMLKYKIQEELVERLYLLEDYEIIIVCDDSGSMKTTIDETDRTRWDQLCYIVKIILELGIIFDSTGVDIYFLNRGSFHNIKNIETIDEIFSVPPRGYTPLVPILRHVFKLPFTRRDNDKKVLVFIATDGAPTDDKGLVNINQLEYLMNEERNSKTTHVMFLLCTDNRSSVDYLDEWDKQMINVDVIDDYKTEKDKIRSFRGQNYPFSIGDYIVKALIGAIDPQMDSLNEPNPVFHITNH